MAFSGPTSYGAFGGANAFAGPSFGGNFPVQEGFQSSSQQQGGFLESPSSQREEKSFQQSLIPATIRQLYQASQDRPDDAFKIDGKEVHQLTLLGMITKAAEGQTHYNFELDDGTGRIDVRIWLDSQNDVQARKKAAWREGIYVCIVGRLVSFNERRSVVAFHIKPVTDFNQVTHHFLQAIYVHLYNKNVLQHGRSVPPVEMPAANVHDFGGDMGGFSLSNLQLKVLNSIRSCFNPEGAPLSNIIATLKHAASEGEIRNAIEFLSSEGHVYSTIDEEHFRAAD